MTYSTYQLNKQGDNIQPWCTPFPNLEPVCCSMSNINYCFLTCIQVLQETGRWSGLPISKNFPQFLVIHTVKGFGVVHETEVGVFLEFSCFFYDPIDVGNRSLVPLPFLNPAWTSGSSGSQVVLKPCLENFEHYSATMWNECSCVVIWTFFGIALLWGWNEIPKTFPILVSTAEFSRFPGILSAAP